MMMVMVKKQEGELLKDHCYFVIGELRKLEILHDGVTGSSDLNTNK